MNPSPRPPPRTNASTRRTLLLIVLIGVAPVVASYVAYYVWQRDARANYGTLIAQPAPALAGITLEGRPFSLADVRGRWVMLWQGSGECTGGCAKAIYATRQARTMQNTEEDRVVRVWIAAGDAAPSSQLLAEHPGLLVARANADALASWPQRSNAIYLIDPLGNLVLAWPVDPDIKALAKDLSTLLRASRIG